MCSISIVRADDFDLHELIELQRAVYGSHLKRYSVDTSFMTEELFAWKYSPPTGTAKLAVARSDGSLRAAVAALPLCIGVDGRRCRLWRVVDIATHPEARGKGLFTELLSALHDDLGADEALGAFPNKNSTPGFLKAGAREADYAPIWVRPVLPGLGSAHRDTKALSDFSSCRDETLGRLVGRPGKTSFVRSREHLNWRYVQHPNHTYQIHLLDHGSTDSALIVFRETTLYRRRMLLIVEWWASSARAAGHVLRVATDHARKHRVHYMITVNNTFGLTRGVRRLFLPVPRFLSPKQHVMRGFASGETARDIFFREWSIQMGDLLYF